MSCYVKEERARGQESNRARERAQPRHPPLLQMIDHVVVSGEIQQKQHNTQLICPAIQKSIDSRKEEYDMNYLAVNC